MAGLLIGFAGPIAAQSVPRTLTCNDGRARAVAPVPVSNGTIAKASMDEGGRPVIQYDARAIDGITSQQQLFVYAHECGHHALGHDSRGAAWTAAQEHDADCYGIRSLIARAGLTSDDVTILEMAMRDLAPGNARHFPWRTRPYDFEGCLPDVAARRLAAARSGESRAEDCIDHNDGENAIANKSRDGRVIDGVYAVRNRCPREMKCTFTIEVGTLLDSDVDVGSTRSFRVQKTLTEQQVLRPAGSAAPEFRFHATVETLPAGESVDFRVIPACTF